MVKTSWENLGKGDCYPQEIVVHGGGTVTDNTNHFSANKDLQIGGKTQENAGKISGNQTAIPGKLWFTGVRRLLTTVTTFLQTQTLK